MKTYPKTAVALSFVLVFLLACYSYQIQQTLEERDAEGPSGSGEDNRQTWR